MLIWGQCDTMLYGLFVRASRDCSLHKTVHIKRTLEAYVYVGLCLGYIM